MHELLRRALDEMLAEDFLAGEEWRIACRGASESQIEERLRFLYDPSEPRREALRVGVLNLLEFVPSALPEPDGETGEVVAWEPNKGIPFFSETYLYGLLWKEDARSVLARARSLARSVDLDFDLGVNPATRYAGLDWSDQIMPMRRDAYLAGIRWRDEFPEADWQERRRHLWSLYPEGSQSARPTPAPDLALVSLLGFVPEATPKPLGEDDRTAEAPATWPLFSRTALEVLLPAPDAADLLPRIEDLVGIVGFDPEALQRSLAKKREQERIASARALRLHQLSSHARRTGEVDHAALQARHEVLRKEFPFVAVTTPAAEEEYGSPVGTRFLYAARTPKGRPYVAYGYDEERQQALVQTWEDECVTLFPAEEEATDERDG